MSRLIELGYTYDPDSRIWRQRGTAGTDFSYTDGLEVEQRLLKVVTEAQDLSTSSSELEAGVTDWPSLYHLSDRRANLLKPLSDVLRGRILEIGAGCGAITRFLGEQGLDVVALEGSPARAKIAAQRCRDLPTVEVLSSTLQDMEGSLEANVVLLIGVLEYARIYFPATDHADAVDAMLAAARGQLSPEGKIIIAIENQLGLKYLSGFDEDHIGKPFVGLEDRYQLDGAVTFGRLELSSKLAAAGLPVQSWWFSFPDYKFPTVILSDKACTTDAPFDVSPLLESTAVADPQSALNPSFSLRRAWHVVARNRLFGELANSFLVVASAQALPADDVLACYFGSGRHQGFRKLTAFRKVGEGVRVERTALFPHLTPAHDRLEWQLLAEAWLPGVHWQSELLRVLGRPNWSQHDINRWAGVWWDTLISEVQGTSLLDGDPASHDAAIDGSFLDAVPRNLMVADGRGRFFDLEWVIRGKLPLQYMIFRGMLSSLLDLPACAPPQPGTHVGVFSIISNVSGHLGLRLTDENMNQFCLDESRFQTFVHGTPVTAFEALERRKLAIDRAEPSMTPHQSSMLGEISRTAGLNVSNVHKMVNDLSDLRQQVSVLLDYVGENISLVQNSINEQCDALNFDANWYRKHYTDVRDSGIDPFVHYLVFGIKEGRKPRL